MDNTYLSSFWPHNPPHWYEERGVYIVTGGTNRKEHFFHDRVLIEHLTDTLLEFAVHYGWTLQAWAVLANHYHYVAETDTPATLPRFMQRLHSVTALKANRHHGTPGRQVWNQYWDTRISYYSSWLARLNYVNQNPVKHGLVKHAHSYPYCSAAWMTMKASNELVKTLRTFDFEKVEIEDDF
jgi:putative transposase